jgi:hypothetical protein
MRRTIKMNNERTFFELTLKDLYKELVARGARDSGKEMFSFSDEDEEEGRGRNLIVEEIKNRFKGAPKPNPALEEFDTWELAKLFFHKMSENTDSLITRGIDGLDDRMDICDIPDAQILKNASSVAAIISVDALKKRADGKYDLRVKNYGKTYNLCVLEPFREQDVALGPMCTGFLVDDRIITTAGHFISEKNYSKYRVVFGYEITDSGYLETTIPSDQIYSIKRIVNRKYDFRIKGADWVLLELDRKVEGHSIANLCQKEVSLDLPVYVMGFPMGLPMKFAQGATVKDIKDSYCEASLDIYMGNSGSPVFNSKTHEVVGLASQGHIRDFLWTGKGWMSVRYPSKDFPYRSPKFMKTKEIFENC